jgi:hypothetical protein
MAREAVVSVAVLDAASDSGPDCPCSCHGRVQGDGQALRDVVEDALVDDIVTQKPERVSCPVFSTTTVSGMPADRAARSCAGRPEDPARARGRLARRTHALAEVPDQFPVEPLHVPAVPIVG